MATKILYVAAVATLNEAAPVLSLGHNTGLPGTFGNTRDIAAAGTKP